MQGHLIDFTERDSNFEENERGSVGSRMERNAQFGRILKSRSMERYGWFIHPGVTAMFCGHLFRGALLIRYEMTGYVCC